ncbi:hypothetical protein BLNAU_19330 [Blattamonas nauphoetae]|uniref:Uncharacterized protein n=1 Tax=Blattamonas nauphoetae TaxID=2049346 RepID=A0ABQ9X338_9EUKA|nr:hypothetical protein BLNAU_19330 [Blattamonas nauphoetae]
MSHLIFNCESLGTAIGLVTSTKLTILSCSIISNPESSPFVISTAVGVEGSDLSVIDSSYSPQSSSILLPLTDLSKSSHLPSNRQHSVVTTDLISVSVHGLPISNVELLRGTGPLVAFPTIDNNSLIAPVSTSLVGIRLLNVTSQSVHDQSVVFNISQRIISTEVTHSNNHLSGTPCIDINSGRSFLCQNTSFAHCQADMRPSEWPEYTLQNIKTGSGIRLDSSNLTVEHIKFSRCTFFALTKINYRPCAIYYWSSQPGSLSITECSFMDIRNGSDSIIYCHTGGKSTITLTKSCFRNCNSSSHGACLTMYASTSLTVSECFFKDTNSSFKSGAFFLQDTPVVVLANSVFCGMRGTSAGALYIINVTGLQTNFLQIRKPVTSFSPKDALIQDCGTSDHIKDIMQDCDSDSDTTERDYGVYVVNNGDTSTFNLTRPTSAAIQTFTSALTPNQTSLKITLTLSVKVKGTLFVLVDNTGGYDPLLDLSAPPIVRLLSFPFPTSATSSTITIDIGEWEFLQFESEYKIVDASISNKSITFSSPLSFTTPSPTRVSQVNCVLSSDPSTCLLRLCARHLPPGTYRAFIAEIPDYSFCVTFGDPDETNRLVVSSDVSFSMNQEDCKLRFDTEYTINRITPDTSPESSHLNTDTPIFLDPPLLLFRTPNPPRVFEVICEYVVSEYKTNISLCGRNVPKGNYTVELNEVPNFSFQVEFDGKVEADTGIMRSKKATVTMSLEGDPLAFDTTYTVSRITPLNSEDSLVFETSPLTLVTPNPPRIVSVSSTLTPGTAIVSIQFTARGMSPGAYTVQLSRPYDFNPRITFNETVEEGTDLQHSSIVVVDFSEAGCKLKFNTTYHLLYVNPENTYTKIINETTPLSFTTPNPPRIVSVLCSQHLNTSSVSVILRAKGVVPGLYKVEVKELAGFSFPVTFDGTVDEKTGIMTSTAAIVPLSIKGDTLSFNTSYTLSTVTFELTNEIQTLETSPITFTTPNIPRIISMSCALDPGTPFVNVQVLGKGIESGLHGLYIADVNEKEYLISFSRSAEVGTGIQRSSDCRLSMASTNGVLKFGTTYTLSKVTKYREDEPLPCETSPITFTTPDPPRIVAASCVLIPSTMTASFQLSGKLIVAGRYQVTLNDSNVPPFWISFSDEEDEAGIVLSASLTFPLSDEETALHPNTLYTITKIKAEGSEDQLVIDPPSHQFKTPNPPRILFVNCRQYGKTADVSVTLTGAGLLRESYRVYLDHSQTPSFLVTFEDPEDYLTGHMNSSWSPIPVSSVGDNLRFNTSYEITDVANDNTGESVRLETSPLSFTTHNPPRIDSISCDLVAGSLSAVVRLSGKNISNGVYEVDLYELRSGSLIVEFNETEEEGTGIMHSTEVTLPLASTGQNLIFDKTYTIRRVRPEGTYNNVVVDPLTLSFTAPNPPRIVSVLCEHVADSTSVTVKLQGRGIVLGVYQVFVDGMDGHSVTVSFDNPADEQTGLMTSSAAELHLALDETSFNFDTTYTLSKVKMDVEEDPLLFDPSVITFTTPNPPRIESVVCEGIAGSSSVSIQLIGKAVTAGSYRVYLNHSQDSYFLVSFDGRAEAGTKIVRSSKVTRELSSSGDALRFNKEYIVTAVKREGTSDSIVMMYPTPSFTTPDLPRIDSVTCELVPGTSSASMRLSGKGITTGSYRVSVNEVEALSFLVVFDTPVEEGTGIMHSTETTVALASSGQTLRFDTKCTISSVKHDGTGDLVILDPPTLSFTTPNPPRIEDAACEILFDTSSCSVQLVGESLLAGDYTLILLECENSPITLTCSGKAESGTKKIKMSEKTIVKVGSSHPLKFNGQYHVKTVTKEGSTDPLILDPPTIEFTVPDPPRLESIETASFTNDAMKDVLSFPLTGVNIPAESLVVVVTASNGNVQLSATFSVRSHGVLTARVYPSEQEERQLDYNSEYPIETVTDHLGTPIFVDGLNVRTLEEPTRIEGVSNAELNDQKTELTVTLSGRMFTAGLLSISLKRDDVDIPLNTIVSFVSETEISFDIPVSAKETSTTLQFGSQYKLLPPSDTLDAIVVNSNVVLRVPQPPMVTTISSEVSENCTHLRFHFSGVDLPSSGHYTATLSSGGSFTINFVDGFSEWIDGMGSGVVAFDSEHVISSFVDASGHYIPFKDNKLVAPPEPSSSVVTLAVCKPSSTNTTFTLELIGENLDLDASFLVTFTSSESITMSFNNAARAVSSTQLLGRPGSLDFDKTYIVKDITPIDGTAVVRLKGTVFFTTPKMPDRLVLVVNRGKGEDSEICGDTDLPCVSVEAAWKITQTLPIDSVVLEIAQSAHQTKPIEIDEATVVITNHGTMEPTLVIPSSATMEGKKGMIVANKGKFEVLGVRIEIEPIQPEFVFLFASSSTIILKDTSIHGQSTKPVSNGGELVCSWETGIIQLEDSTTTIQSTPLTHLPQGAVNIKNGTITVISSTFSNNSPSLSAFPSFRQNIRCSDGGDIEVESLLGGDGTADHRSAWFSLSDCVISGEDWETNTPFFIPTLNAGSSVEWKKKEKRLDVALVGSLFIPCGLFFEVFEKKTDRSIGQTVKIDLSTESNHFTENSIILQIPLSRLASLSSALEWRGRLIFGKSQTPTDSILVQLDSVNRRAETTKENMKWWLPLVISLSVVLLIAIFVVIIVIRRCKLSKEKKNEELKKKELDEVDEEQAEKMDFMMPSTVGSTAIQVSAAAIRDNHSLISFVTSLVHITDHHSVICDVLDGLAPQLSVSRRSSLSKV